MHHRSSFTQVEQSAAPDFVQVVEKRLIALETQLGCVKSLSELLTNPSSPTTSTPSTSSSTILEEHRARSVNLLLLEEEAKRLADITLTLQGFSIPNTRSNLIQHLPTNKFGLWFGVVSTSNVQDLLRNLGYNNPYLVGGTKLGPGCCIPTRLVLLSSKYSHRE